MTTTKTALITGASRGLGLALARELANTGWQLILNARGAEALEAARVQLSQKTTVIAIAGDVSNAAHRHELRAAAEKLGGLDVVVNNASILGPSPQPNLLDYPLDVLEEVYRINVIAPLALLQAVRGTLKDDARIINVSSDAGVEAYPGWGGYGSSKAALEHLSAILAVENPTFRVYWVDPGDMQTRMHQEAFPGEDISDRPLPETSIPGFIELLTGSLPGGRYQARKIGQPEVNRAKSLNVVLTVSNFDQALGIYRDALNLPVLKEWHQTGHGVLLDAGRALLEIVDEKQAAAVDQVEAGRRVSGQVRLAFEVSDVEKAANSMQQNGAIGVNNAVMTDWGHYNQRVHSPDNLQITLFQIVNDETLERA